jgi:hypothetical protein
MCQLYGSTLLFAILDIVNGSLDPLTLSEISEQLEKEHEYDKYQHKNLLMRIRKAVKELEKCGKIRVLSKKNKKRVSIILITKV